MPIKMGAGCLTLMCAFGKSSHMFLFKDEYRCRQLEKEGGVVTGKELKCFTDLKYYFGIQNYR